MYKNYIIQIGSHVGNTKNDPIFKIINQNVFLILVEPIPHLFEKLKKNYKNKNLNNKIIFINKAVSSFSGKIEITTLSKNNDFNKLPHWSTQISSINPSHVAEHIPGAITEKIEVSTTTIDEIIKENNIKEINLLHIDTEGHDYEILINYDFSIKPNKIIFEHKHMDGVFKIGKKYKLLLNKLYSFGYVLKAKDSENTIVELKTI